MIDIPPTLDYLYVDEQRLAILADLAGTKGHDEKTSWKVVISLNPHIERQRDSVPRLPSPREQITAVVKYLRRNGLLRERRPKTMRELDRVDSPPGAAYTDPDRRTPFVFETMQARKVIFPGTTIEDIQGLRQLAVWVSDPIRDDVLNGQSELGFPGMFVYLTEAHWDDGELQTVWSGCSALQAVGNFANRTGKVVSLDHIEPSDVFGRGSNQHPVLSLKRCGGIPAGDVRTITALYRIRYVTNEQAYTYQNTRYRVCDLLGYPIFIGTT
jgi:hypothetical protein